jgi:thiamine biosynthesis lipoprotein
VTAVFSCMISSVFAAERLHESRSYLGTTVSTTICYGADQKDKADIAMKAVWQKFADVHARMNAFDPASDVSAINASLGREVKVHEDVYRLLEKSKALARTTGGVFDITVGPLVALWKQAGKLGHIPSAEAVREAKRSVAADRIELLGDGRVRIPSEMKIDLGGDAAGFAADEAAGILRVAGFNDFLVDAGGEIYAGGSACEERPWRVGVNDPENKDRWADVVELKDQALSTSGSYEKYIEINGERWPHIVNPLTGYPERGVVSATVISPNAIDADALSTTLCVLGSGPGFRLIDSLGAGYAAMIMAENEAGRLEESVTRGYAVFRVK